MTVDELREYLNKIGAVDRARVVGVLAVSTLSELVAIRSCVGNPVDQLQREQAAWDRADVIVADVHRAARKWET
jgi:hypothetical protein